MQPFLQGKEMRVT